MLRKPFSHQPRDLDALAVEHIGQRDTQIAVERGKGLIPCAPSIGHFNDAHAWLNTLERPRTDQTGLYRTELQALDHFLFAAKLPGGENLDRDAAFGAVVDLICKTGGGSVPAVTFWQDVAKANRHAVGQSGNRRKGHKAGGQ